MKNLIRNLQNLNKLPFNSNFNTYNKYHICEHFYLNEGVEHYQLLAYLSLSFNDKLFFDVGTYRGYSALALGLNKNNKVMSYDIVDEKLNNFDSEENIKFILGDATEDENLLKSDLILLDTAHDGIFESKFLNFLKNNSYNGVVIMDDVNYYPILRTLANQLKENNIAELIELTQIGHYSGTLGLIFN